MRLGLRVSVMASALFGLTGHEVLLGQNYSQPPVQTCTVASINGTPVAGVVCGGSSHGLGCTAGAVYNCKSGPVGMQNNCTLAQACAIGCVTKGSPNPLNDSCFTGPSPIVV